MLRYNNCSVVNLYDSCVSLQQTENTPQKYKISDEWFGSEQKNFLEIAEAPSVSTRKNFDTFSEQFITKSEHKQLKAREHNKQKRTANIGAYSHVVSTNQPKTRYTYPANQYDKIKIW